MKLVSGGRQFVSGGLLLALILSCVPALGAQTYVEDFEDDILGNTVAGYASSVFSHTIAGQNAFLTDDSFSLAVPPSLHHQLFMGAATTDFVTFLLPAGSKVSFASVAMTGTGGGRAAVDFVDANLAVYRLESLLQDSYQVFDTSLSGFTSIIAIVLNVDPPMPFAPGMEALYDNITIQVVPEPSSWILGGMAFVGLCLWARRQRA